MKPGNHIIVGLAIAALFLVSGLATASSKCQTVEGKFVLQPVSEPECSSAVNICATGSYKGGLKGKSKFTGTSLIPTADTPSTAVVLLTGDNIIHTDQGDLFTKDAIVLRTNGAGEFNEVDIVVGATRDLTGAASVLQAVGTFTAAGGEGE